METKQYFEVTYLDTDCGRIRAEAFDDLADAERFASRQAADENGWAIIDAVAVQEGQQAA
ncbi:hypothetical protein [uncultured Arthrobacter sp.]|uniref:hypothetical protein n=1 Tax=uncultured Arthrobacter sp. TaxID=114050 RepID=UPI0032165ACD